MTLTTLSIKAVAQGNSATTVWPFTFLIPALADLVVTLVDVVSGNQTVVNPVNYSVTGLGNSGGGSVTYPLSGLPITAATKIVVSRSVANLQQTDLTNQGGAYPADIEDALDYITMITQQLQDQINRSIIFSIADLAAGTLPVASARVNKILGFDAFGNPAVLDTITPGTTVSAAMIPVATALTTAAALTALGIPGSLIDALIPSGTCWDYDAGGSAPAGFVYPIGQACTALYPDYRAKLISAGSPYGTNGVDPLMPDRRSLVSAGKSNMGGVDNGLLPGGTVLGSVLGSATRVLLTTNLPPYTPVGVNTGGVYSHPVTPVGGLAGAQISVLQASADANVALITQPTFTGTPQGGLSTSFSIVQPTFICNKILKVH